MPSIQEDYVISSVHEMPPRFLVGAGERAPCPFPVSYLSPPPLQLPPQRPRNGKVPESFRSVRASPIDCYSRAYASMFWLDGFVDDSVILAPLFGGFVS